jgi:hypothetical protein
MRMFGQPCSPTSANRVVISFFTLLGDQTDAPNSDHKGKPDNH